jgi:hypothetical protein
MSAAAVAPRSIARSGSAGPRSIAKRCGVLIEPTRRVKR